MDYDDICIDLYCMYFVVWCGVFIDFVIGGELVGVVVVVCVCEYLVVEEWCVWLGKVMLWVCIGG